jgi:four helix bundle protein
VGSFENLAVYRRAVALADEIAAVVVRWPSFHRWTAGVQLVRAADSIGANIAEANGRAGDPDQRRLLVIARGSTYEAQHWLERARARGLECPAEAAARAAEVGRMLNGLVRSLQRPATSD